MPTAATDSPYQIPGSYGTHTVGGCPYWPPPPTSTPNTNPNSSHSPSKTKPPTTVNAATAGMATEITCNPSVCSIPQEYANQASFYGQSGFWITNASYDLRPEVLESIYYAYRVTGNTMYQDWSWVAFQAINAMTRVGSGYSEINNVNAPGGGGFPNVQESFLFVEVMKYAYLT